MIISKYSGNIVGYVDYYAAVRKRVNRYSKVAPVARVKRDGYLADKADYEYWKFYCRRVSENNNIRQSKCKVWQKLVCEAGLYTKLGDYRTCCEIGSFIDVTI